MKPVPLKVARIGNSRGVRLPAATLERYQIGAEVMMEERSDGILLRPVGGGAPKLSWQDTAGEMAVALEEWGDWESATGDGLDDLDDLEWTVSTPRRVAENQAAYPGSARRRRA